MWRSSRRVQDPHGKFVGVEVKDNSDGTLSAAYTPLVAGPHVVEVLLSGQHVGGANGYAKVALFECFLSLLVLIIPLCRAPSTSRSTRLRSTPPSAKSTAPVWRVAP